MMELLRAYARQVVSYLPASQRDELFAELYDSLCEEYQDRAGDEPGLGEAAFLNRYRTHPMKYATKLAGEGGAWLVGPQFYYSFLSALKIAASLVVIFHLVIGAVRVFAGGQIRDSLIGFMFAIPDSLLWVGAAVLGVFVALEKSGERASWLDKWNAGELEPADGHQSVSRGEALFDLALSSFALLWVLDLVRLPAMVRHDGVWVREWSVNLPEWFWWAAGLLLAADILFALFRLTRSLWTRPMRGVKIVMQMLWIGMLLFAARQPDLLSVDHETAAQFLPLIEKATRGGLLVACAVIAWDTLVHAWRLGRRSNW